ncbi:hypothetical protein A2Y85_00485 [candidate division WOR-3 bacterium RBG_13_43_14]|uniref:histidine kinase n=1 Tax=candidate division WOR-3 bacterium RBG_13_43_14 TaxID=1802590 RepID=A0A1F4UB28_UNCW3|nr:MAG: hypothetical protein A2Y85_00485 [candidate division WOR-3 bacterium RBG_13_43_14]
MRQNFISLVSHEMRTPLVAAMQYLELMGGNIVGALNTEQTRIVNRMKSRLSDLLALIDRWLELARIEDHQVTDDFETFDFSPVVKEALEIIKPLADEKKIKIRDMSGDDVKLNGDRNMIKEIIVNLVSNGIKYNREGGEVTVQKKQESGFIVIDISDTGFGIPEEELGRIGKEFYRVKREGLAVGFGLGLAIVKKILDIHNGRLEIKSAVDQGSTFRMYLPISTAVIGKTAAASCNCSRESNKKGG